MACSNRLAASLRSNTAVFNPVPIEHRRGKNQTAPKRYPDPLVLNIAACMAAPDAGQPAD